MVGFAYLEGKMLEEVRSAVGLVGLSSGASIDPHADRGRLSPWRVLGGNLVPSIISFVVHSRVHSQLASGSLTVRPFLSVVVWVCAPKGDVTGVAKPRFTGRTALRAARLRSPWERLRASLLDAIAAVMVVRGRRSRSG
jgi:hypothetical protein